MKRTPWFNYMEHSPAKEGMYEVRCTYGCDEIWQARYSVEHDEFVDYDSTLAIIHGCDRCQWRGLTTKDGDEE